MKASTEGRWLVVMTIDGTEVQSSAVTNGDHYKCTLSADRLNASAERHARVRWIVRKAYE